MDITAFRAGFPEFTDSTKYTDAMITFWASIGDLLLNELRWDTLLTQGLWLYTAHNIALQAQDVASSATGRTPGMTAGVITGKGVGGVSVSYDASFVFFELAGNYNMTKYGRNFWQLMQIVGTGGYQII